MNTRRSASLDGSLLARKGDATPAVPGNDLPAEGRATSAADALSESWIGLAARFRPLTKGRRGLIALVSVALLAVVLVATEPWWGATDQMAQVPYRPPASPVPVADTTVTGHSSDLSAMPALPAPIVPAVHDASTQPPAPVEEPVRDEVIRAAVVSDTPPPTTALKKPVETPARPAAPPVTSGPYILQLAAFSNEKAAHGEATRLQGRLTAVLGERRVVVVKAENAERRPVWRLRASAYPTFAEARAACDRIRKLKAGCWVIRR